MRTTRIIFAAAIAALLAAFAFAAWSAARTKGPTYDETLHAPASVLHLRVGDYRVSAEHPPLWKYWAGLPSLFRPLPELNLDDAAFRRAERNNVEPWTWAKRTMYATPGNDPDRLLFQARAMMLALAVGVGALMAAWAWRLGGALAALIAATLFALDPNLIAHAPLITNDVATTGTILLCAIATWHAGRRLTAWRAVMLGLACGVALVTKFTGVLVVPIVALLLVGRALAPRAWAVGRGVRASIDRVARSGETSHDDVATKSPGFAPAASQHAQTRGSVAEEDRAARSLDRPRDDGDDDARRSLASASAAEPQVQTRSAVGDRSASDDGRTLTTRRARLLATFATLAIVAVVAYATMWATYRFRYDATPGGEVRFELRRLADEAMIERAKQRDGVVISREEAAQRLDLTCRAILFAGEHRLVPEAYLGGFLHAYAQSMYRATYVLGTPGGGGVWWYFPFALLVKEPIATLAVAALAAIVAIRRVLNRNANAEHRTPNAERRRDDASASFTSTSDLRVTPDAWTWACLLVPPAVVLVAAMRVNLNIGVRHVFAIYPFAFIAIGLVLAPTLRAAARGRKVFAGILAAALAAESLAAWPDYLPFFNVVAGGQRGGLKLLGDSNLDWGQDVPLLLAWQRAHPDRTLTLAYFGTDDPRARGLRYTSLIDDGSGIPPVDALPTSGVVAISATMLQIRWDDPIAAHFFATAKELPPTEVLGGSIYLYDLGGR